MFVCSLILLEFVVLCFVCDGVSPHRPQTHGPPASVSLMLGCHTCYCAQLLPERIHSGLDIDGSLEWCQESHDRPGGVCIYV